MQLLLLALFCLQAVHALWQVPAHFVPVRGHSKHAHHKSFFPLSKGQRELFHHERQLRQKNAVARLDSVLYQSYILIANVSVGTPASDYCLEFFYGSSDMWLVDPSAKAKKNASLPATKTFNSSLSSSFVKDGRKMSADSGYVKGVYGSDWVTIGGVKLNLTFGVATSLSNWIYYRPVDGEFGLNYETPKSGVPSALAQVLNQTEKPIFSFYFQGAKELGGNGRGVLTFGGEDKTTCEDTYTYPDQSDGQHLSFGLNAVSIGSSKLSLSNVNVSITTWSPFFYTSKNVTAMFAAAAGGVWNNTAYATVVECDNKNASFAVNFDVGKDVSLKMTVGDFIAKRPDGVCILAVYGYTAEDNTTWYFPKFFLKSRCIAINMQTNKLGFSNLRKQS